MSIVSKILVVAAPLAYGISTDLNSLSTNPQAAQRGQRRQLAGIYCWECSEHGTRPWWTFGWGGCDCSDGWEGSCCEIQPGFQEGDFTLKRIQNDQVEHELAYVKAGSEFPELYEGIFWMDQRGVHLPQASDPDYNQVGPSAADELLITFGEAEWDPVSNCATPVPVYGGQVGHWTYMDQDGEGSSDVFDGALAGRLTLGFCLRDGDPEHIDITMKLKADNLIEGVLGALGIEYELDGSDMIDVPWEIIHLQMVKKPWGWDRLTTLGPNAAVKAFAECDHVPSTLRAMLQEAVDYTTFHYPVFQIVDGNGERTEHYEAYLEWASRDVSGCKEGDYNDTPCPLNQGGGTSLVGVPVHAA